MLAAVTFSISPTRSGTATTSSTIRPMATSATAARMQPSRPIRRRARRAVIGDSSRLHGPPHHAALEVATPEVTETTEVASRVAERATAAKPRVPSCEVAALGASRVGGGIGSPRGSTVVPGISETGIGDDAANHVPCDRAHEVAHHETAQADTTYARACRHTGPGPLQCARLAHLRAGGEPGERARILVIGRAGRALGRGQRRVQFLQHHAPLFRG